MFDSANSVPASDSTRVFRMPADDATAPDLMKSVTINAPVLSIVKGPQVGASFELEGPEISLGRDPNSSIFRQGRHGGGPWLAQRHLGRRRHC